MAKKSAKNQKSNELDAQEFFTAIALIEKERGSEKLLGVQLGALLIFR